MACWSPFFIFQQRLFVSRSNLNSGYSCIKIVVKKEILYKKYKIFYIFACYKNVEKILK